MKADYLELTNGRKVRIMWNMNALGFFTSTTGKEISDLSGPKVDVNLLRTIAWCAAIEGEDAEGRVLELSEKEFGRLIDMATTIKFSEILTSQTAGTAQKKSEVPKRSPIVLWR